MNAFDDLFSKYFGKNKGKKDGENKKDESPKNEKEDNKNEDIPKIGDSISEIREIKDLNDLPDDIPPHIKALLGGLIGGKGKGFMDDLDGDNIEREEFETDFGSVVRITVKGMTPEEFHNSDIFRGGGKKIKTLETLLEDAIENEEYEKAAELRDKIAKRDKKDESEEEISKLKEKMKIALENSDYKEIEVLLARVEAIKKEKK